MKRLARSFMVACCAFGLAGAAQAAGDDATIQAFEDGQQAGWNAHDAKAYAAAFAEDADVVTSLGWHWTSRAETEQMTGDGFKLIHAHSRVQLTVLKIRMLSPDLALVELNWSMTGALTPDGAAPLGEQHGVETQLLHRSESRWWIVSQQDTVAVSGPVPVAPAAASSAAPASAPSASFPTTPPPVRRCVVARGNGDCLVYGKPKPAAK